MMVLETVLLAFSGSVILLLSVLIYISNSRREVNRALSFFLFVSFIWLICNLLSSISANQQISLLFAKATLIGATLLPASFLLFCVSFARRWQITNKKIFSIFILPVLVLLLAPTSLNVVSVKPYGRETVTGDLYLLLIPMLLFYFTLGFYYLFEAYRRSNSGVQRAQLKYIFSGLILTIVPAIVSNAILPLAGYSGAVSYGPNVVVVFSAFASIAIIKHRLLDIKIIVARSLSYILLLVTLGSLFVVGILAYSSVFLEDTDQSNSVRFAYSSIAILLAFALQPLKMFFDKVTKKIFYRDAYNTQSFLDSLNSVLVSNIDLSILLEQSKIIITDNLKIDFCAFDIGDDSLEYAKNDIKLSKTIKEALRRYFTENDVKLILVDELPIDYEHLKEYLVQKKIEIVVELRSDSTSPQVEIIGYVMLGRKLSGNAYINQDIKTIELISDELLIAVQNALQFAEIQRFNETLQNKIHSATKELRKTNDKLQALDTAKDEFISMASHQLRTPLTSVKGYVSMVLDGDAGPITDQQRQLLQQSFLSSQRMVYLIADLLNVSRLRTGKFIIEAKPTYLPDVIESELDQLADTYKARGLNVIFNKPDKFPVLMLDETKIRQVIMNFTDNAIYYTPSGGRIEIVLRETPYAIEFDVNDSGIGVPKAEQHHLFTKFYRAHNAKRARPDGTGLGLFMAKKVIVAQGGSVVFRSTEGKGSTFGFTFPKHKLLVGAKPKK